MQPCSVADRQLAVYNAHDIDGYCALFASDAVISDLVTGQFGGGEGSQIGPEANSSATCPSHRHCGLP